MNDDFDNFKKKQRYEIGKTAGSADEIKSELMVERQQNANLRSQIDNMQEELYEVRQEL